MTGEISYMGQVAIVTGAGRGIGRSHALELARRGARVVVNDLIAGNASAVVAEIASRGGEAVASFDDVSTPSGGASAVAAAIERFGTVDVVINNAGMLRPGYFEDLKLAQIRSVIDANLMSAIWVTQPAWSVLKKKGYGRVIVTSSGSGMFGHHGVANYAAAKAGLYGLVKALAYEGREHGITVNAVMPMARGMQAEGNPIPDRHKFPLIPALADRTEPELVTALVTYLASRACEMNGQAFSTIGARYALAFMGIAEGWVAPTVDDATPEGIHAHFDNVIARDGALVPRDLFEELAAVNEAVAALSG